MLHLKSFTRFSIHLECWNAFRDLVNRITSERNVIVGTSSLSTLKSSRGRPENVLGTSRTNLPGTPLECRIGTSPERHFRTSLGRQIGTFLGRKIRTSPGRSNRTFRRRLGDIGGGRPLDVLETNICLLGSNWINYPR